MDPFLELLETPVGNNTTLLDVASKLLVSGLLGVFIAFLYRRSRGHEERNPGLFPALVLLAMLITLVTTAVGQNIAVAFTLVGTLAIVRFRTTVSDVRDTTFVIFSVAVGIASGQNIIIAVTGTIIIGATILVLKETGTLSDRATPSTGDDGVLRLDITPPNADPEIYKPILMRFGTTTTLRSSRLERDRGRLRLTLACSGLQREDAPNLVTALLEHPEIAEATAEFSDNS